MNVNTVSGNVNADSGIMNTDSGKFGAELFEMMRLIGDKEEARVFRGRFRPSGAELAEYCGKGAEELSEAKLEDLEEFTQW